MFKMCLYGTTEGRALIQSEAERDRLQGVWTPDTKSIFRGREGVPMQRSRRFIHGLLKRPLRLPYRSLHRGWR